jgi:hypothetical protein
VSAELDDLASAFEAVATTDRAGAQREAKKLADYVFDVAAAVILLERADWRLETANDAREAIVAEWFVRRELAAPDARGITAGTDLPDAAFEAVVRFDTVEPEVRVAPTADD